MMSVASRAEFPRDPECVVAGGCSAAGRGGAGLGGRSRQPRPTAASASAAGASTSARATSRSSPGDDFERYASGKWMDATEIPADKSSERRRLGASTTATRSSCASIVTGAPADSQIGAFYASYMDEARLEQLDAAPLKADLARVDAIKTKAEFASYMARQLLRLRRRPCSRLGVLPDPANPTMNIAFVGTSGMGLPDRDYYLLDKYKPQRDAYRAYIQRTLELTGTPNASAAADAILAFETEIAKLSWPQADLRDLDKLNNPMTPAQLAAYAPGLDWNRYLADTRVGRRPS